MKRQRIVACFESTGEVIEWTAGDDTSTRTNHERFGRHVLSRVYRSPETVTITVTEEDD